MGQKEKKMDQFKMRIKSERDDRIKQIKLKINQMDFIHPVRIFMFNYIRLKLAILRFLYNLINKSIFGEKCFK